MNSKHLAAVRARALAPAAVLFLIATLAVVPATSAFAQTSTPAFSKTFMPPTIGPGSASLLVFTIDTGGGVAVTDLAFTDNLPAGVTLAGPAVPTTDYAGCGGCPGSGCAGCAVGVRVRGAGDGFVEPARHTILVASRFGSAS